MLGNFSYYNPTKLYFDDESLNFLKDELKNYGPVVLLNYGSGSVKRNGIYDIMNHIMEQYFSDFDDNTSDYLAEGLMRSVITISELGATNEMIAGITETTVVYPAGYLNLTKEDITEILKESM